MKVQNVFLFVVLNTCFYNSRQSAPTDGRDQFGTAPNIGYYTSKQNSDASGMFYQWGRKDPFAFATNSESGGKYPVKIYTIDGVLIYQDYKGESNKDKQPVGGVIVSSTLATSMMETIKNPIIFYYGENSDLIIQVGYTKSLWDYYWTSHSRGTDGVSSNLNWHNDYLDGYTAQRVKSIYDPCPYGFRVPSNGIYNDFTESEWITYSYTGGCTWNVNQINNWFHGLGYRKNIIDVVGYYVSYVMSTRSNVNSSYKLILYSRLSKISNHRWSVGTANSVRCIEERCLCKKSFDYQLTSYLV